MKEKLQAIVNGLLEVNRTKTCEKTAREGKTSNLRHRQKIRT
jgi:hypothetical protein